MTIHWVYNFPMKNLVTVCSESQKLAATAQQFADKHKLPFTNVEQATTPFVLYYKDSKVELIDQQTGTAIDVDFIGGTLAHRRKYGGGKGQAIAKAIGLNKYKLPLSVLDVTAGLAKDAFVLGCLGCSVTMLEENPIIAELVQCALRLAERDDEFKTIQQQGFTLININALTYLNGIKNKPDIIYIDPMYPERKKSAAVKKNMQMLQKLVGHKVDKQSEEIELLDNALNTALKRVVVKRPKGSPTLTDKKPSMSIESKITRYDVYVII